MTLGPQGPIINHSGHRDPLAIAFDRAADRLITRAIEAKGAWEDVLIPSPARERNHLDDGGLTHHERAFLQACYYHRLIYLHGFDRRYALNREWGGLVQDRAGLARILRVRVKAVGEASVHAWDQGWTR